ncbi:hypothetical protein L323_02475 [Ruminiclostridium papyrosolvens C7]|uniref:Uncharacterized protein n=1 Tax=Ruminiclostridium papyrosolvens C7 TaxID=1330534 RepID=U4R5E2_9FIRM|nr:hypothetical protein L323_02475 [Ruminiclostridium papyrosolvens C7]
MVCKQGGCFKTESFSVLNTVLPYKIISMIASRIFARVSSGSS